MNTFQLVKYDIKKTFKSLWNYIGILFIFIVISGIVYSFLQTKGEASSEQIIRITAWIFSVQGLIVLIKVLTRDISQNTLQLFLNKSTNRNKYLIGKIFSILFVIILFSFIVTIYTLAVQLLTNGDHLKIETFLHFLFIYFLYFLIFGLTLFFITIYTQSQSLIFTLGLFIILIIPILNTLVPLVPIYGENITNILNYIPFSYLTTKLYQGDFNLSAWQILISVILLFLLLFTNYIMINKKDV
ncbi:ABC transporter permease subunit [Staphylococcus pseudintermedius]|uniref:ABC transporter permease subunit n=1 Tax=Staphylococcus pseudintermedius TaxID=283734 RepID=UPI0035C1670E